MSFSTILQREMGLRLKDRRARTLSTALLWTFGAPFLGGIVFKIYFTLLIYIFSLAACAKEKPEDAPSCSVRVDAYQIRYPDGIVRKSDVYDCPNNCTKIVFVNDPNIHFEECQ